MTYAARRDANHQAIRDALRQAGAYVIDMASWPGAGFDLLVVYRQQTWLAEIKTPRTRHDLTIREIDTRVSVTARGGAYVVWCSVNEALKGIGAI